MEDRPAGTPSDYLAAERTFLAWIRTGLALMGFGFVVARFGLFLQALPIAQSEFSQRTAGASPWFGTALIVLGIAVQVGSAWSHIRLVRNLQNGGHDFARPSSLAIGVAMALAVLGLGLAIYLLSIRPPGHSHHTAEEKSMHSENGIVTAASRHTVDETVRKLESALDDGGVKRLALIDHTVRRRRPVSRCAPPNC